jgi:rhomboid protease GluP
MSTVLAWRDALVRTLAFDRHGGVRPGARLLRYDAEEVALLLPHTAEPLVVRAPEPGDSLAPAALRARLEELTAVARNAHVSVLVLGGDAAIDTVLRASARWMGGPLLILRAAADGGFWRRPLVSKTSGSVVHQVRYAIGDSLRAVASGTARSLSPLEQQALAGTAPAMRMDSAHEDFWDRHAAAPTPVTWTLAAAIVAMFVMEVAWGGSQSRDTLLHMGANVPVLVRRGEWWRLFSAAFLHIGLVHVAVNLWVLYVLGPFLEKILGSARFLVLYGISALAGSLASVWVSRAGLSAGASGALWGLMVAAFALSLRPQGLLPQAVADTLRGRTWQPLVVNTVISFVPGIDLFAHFGGGIAGGALVLSGFLGSARPPLVRAAAAILGLAMALALVLALLHGRPWDRGPML